MTPINHLPYIDIYIWVKSYLWTCPTAAGRCYYLPSNHHPFKIAKCIRKYTKYHKKHLIYVYILVVLKVYFSPCLAPLVYVLRALCICNPARDKQLIALPGTAGSKSLLVSCFCLWYLVWQESSNNTGKLSCQKQEAVSILRSCLKSKCGDHFVYEPS